MYSEEKSDSTKSSKKSKEGKLSERPTPQRKSYRWEVSIKHLFLADRLPRFRKKRDLLKEWLRESSEKNYFREQS